MSSYLHWMVSSIYLHIIGFEGQDTSSAGGHGNDGKRMVYSGQLPTTKVRVCLDGIKLSAKL
jgi:hypothetical protein